MEKKLDKSRRGWYYIWALRDSELLEGGKRERAERKIKKFLTKRTGCDIIAELLERKRESVPCKLNNVKQTKHLEKSDFSGFLENRG